MAGHGFSIRGLDVQNADRPEDATIWLDLQSGYSEPAEAEGEDDVIPGAEGKDPGVWERRSRRLLAVGYTQGFGGTRQEATENWRAATDSLMAVLQLHDDPGLVELHGPYLGIPSGTTRFLEARAIRVLPGPILNRMSHQGWSVELECMDSPPEWQTEAS